MNIKLHCYQGPGLTPDQGELERKCVEYLLFWPHTASVALSRHQHTGVSH